MAKKVGPQRSQSDTRARKTWLHLFKRDQIWNDKDEVLDAVYWLRQILAILTGLTWGFLGLTGFVGIGSFSILNSIAAYAIANNTGYEFEPDESLLSVKEGFMTTFATFLVSWIVTYTAVHHDRL